MTVVIPFALVVLLSPLPVLATATPTEQRPAVASAEVSDAGATLGGVVTINGNVAQQGVRLLARAGDQDCGVAVVGVEGRFSMPLAQPCDVGEQVTVVLAAAPTAASLTLEVSKKAMEGDLDFTGVPDEAIAVVAADAAVAGTPGDGGSAEQVAPLPAQPASLLGQGELYRLLRIIVVTTMVLLVVMVVARIFDSRRRLGFLENMKAAAHAARPGRRAEWSSPTAASMERSEA